MTTEETMRDAFAQALTCTYVCGRVWEAWSVGTMTQDDFQPAAECDEVLDELTAVALAALTLAQQERDELRSALGELVALKDLKDAMRSLRSDPYYVTEADHMECQYENRKPAAWDRARAALTPKTARPSEEHSA